MRPFTVLFGADKAYVAHLATAICSLLDNNKSSFFNIVIITSGVGFSIEDSARITALVKSYGQVVRFENLNESLFDDLPLTHHFQISMYYRLYAAEILDEDVCLYLDSDLVVLGSIDPLINFNLGENFLGAVEDPGFLRHRELKMNSTSNYFNSGVMLINLKKWRSFELQKKVFDRVRELSQAIRFPDQCGLNSVVDGQWCELPPEYNIQTCFFTGKLSESVELKYGFSNVAKVIHFTGTSKPWHFLNKHPFRRSYWYYRNKTLYRSLVSDDLSLSVAVRRLTPNFIKQIIKRAVLIAKPRAR
jgi:lipopolysaccharide biosynthesis glycosyltransferase